MVTMQNYRNLDIWSKAKTLAAQVLRLTLREPLKSNYGIAEQIKRAAISVPSNIAEGCGRDSQKEFLRFLDISLGSLFELETQLEVVNEVWLDFVNNDIKMILKETDILGKMIKKFQDSVSRELLRNRMIRPTP